MTDCPSQQTLQELLAGTLDTIIAVDLNGHLAGCRDCQAKLDALSDDPLMRGWRADAAHARSHSWVGEGPYGELVERLYEGIAPTPREPPENGGAPLAADEPARELPGSKLGDYVVEAELGRGGMGVVYRAWDQVLGRTVALKVLRRELTDGRARARFAREARAAAHVRHGHLVAVHAVGDTPTAAATW
ncbi:MAG TPA: hypothetical protein VGX76_08045 [Pirellulales bacterium]|nr:hypothetical protein [Pirellulales bacterium]